MASLSINHSNILQALDDVNKAAHLDITGTGQAHTDLLESIRKLTLVAEKPGETLMRVRFEALRNAAVRMALEANVLQAVCEYKGEPISAQTLADTTGYNALFIDCIARIMRLVTYVGYCDEVGENEYAANGVTYRLNTPGMIGAERHHYDLFFPIGAVLPQYMRETGFHQFPNKPEDKNPFFYAHGVGFWEFFDKYPEHRKDFDEYMAARRKGLATWHETFPMASILGTNAKTDPEAVLLVDVGGNKGHEITSFHKAHSELPGRLILQDLPPMIERVSKEPPEGIELMPYDFFNPQPVKGARAYYFRNICHDWPDERCQEFLTNTARAMVKGYSRLLIDEYVLPNTGAPFRGPAMDILMMLYNTGMERTMRQWKVLLEACGLEIVKVWGVHSGFEQLIECQLKA